MHVSRLRTSSLHTRIGAHERELSASSLTRAKASKIRSKLSSLSNALRQWVPMSRFLTITAVLDEAGELACTTPSSILGSLASYWKPVFDGSQSQPDKGAIDTVLSDLSDHSWDWSCFNMPGPSQFIHCINSSIDSAPGKNGVPYTGLRHNQIRQSPLPLLLQDAFQVMRAHSADTPCPPMFGFNDLLQNCVPKKEIFPYEAGVACRAGGTRPLSCKNTDNKIICTAVAHA
eukprot:3757937-Karenia_brevis.AAC.1